MKGAPNAYSVSISNKLPGSHALIAAIGLQEYTKLATNAILWKVDVNDCFCVLYASVFAVSHHSPQYSLIARSTLPKSLGIFMLGNIPSGLFAVV